MSEYWSGQISFTGIGSGMDFDSIIEATLSMEDYRADQLKTREATWQLRADAARELNTALISYKETLESMDTLDEFLVKSATSTDSSAISVSADSDAAITSHNVVVGQLAQNDIWSSTTGFADSDKAAITDTDGTFAFTYAGESYSIDVPANCTLSQFANLINSTPGLGGGVRANIINDGDDFHIQLQGMDLGEDNAVEITSSDIPGLDAGDFSHTRTACNARLKVDGFPEAADEWIERDSNSFDDAVPGLKLTLHDLTDANGETLSVETDDEAIKENVRRFVSQTNDIRKLIDELTKYEEVKSTDEDSDTTVTYDAGIMAGNYGMDIVDDSLSSIISSSGLGFQPYDPDTGSGDRYSSLSSLYFDTGATEFSTLITTETDEESENFGLLLLDEEVLDEFLSEDPEALASLFAAEGIGSTDSGDFAYSSHIPGKSTPGEYDVAYTVSGGAITGATINGEPALVNGWEITADFGTDAEGLTLQVYNRSDGAFSGTAYLKQGKIPQTVDELERLTDPEDGTLVTIADNYDEIAKETRDQIDEEEARLSRLESSLRSQYASLEATLTYYNNLSQQVSSQLSSLSA